MRTTVEMKPQHHSALLALAARRGEKGFSSVLAEAIEEYLNEERTRVQRRKEVLSLAGALSSDEAKTLRSTTKSLRENWR
jgi:metal-responsive CopG/Arc/MetJ family transcriptional regulator